MSKKNIFNKQIYITFFCFFIILCLVVFVYFPGLFGDFLFDDYSNLNELTRYGDLSHWENAKQFIMNGIAGPSGRPISLITFITQADAWPENAFPFKIINLIIHLFCGVLLYWVTMLLLISYGYLNNKAAWIALISSSIWLLHPLFVSTTLYVIQRMAQLPLLFSLLGILGYLKGRKYITIQPLYAYSIMTLSIGICTILATLSKENGSLLPLLILILEFCNVSINKPNWVWRVACLWIPSFSICLLLIHYIDFSNNPWPNRPFNQIERLLTEGRILCDYLFSLFVPNIEGHGLFQDGYIISKGWFNPISTLISYIFLIFLILSAFIVRRVYPLFSLAVLFFFSAHLMESTVIGLELYFEHRNYLAAIFIFLPLAAGLVHLTDKINLQVVVLSCALIFLTLAWMTWQRSMLWSNDLKLQLYWAQNSPNSPRAQSLIAQQLLLNGKEEESLHMLEQAIKRRPDSGMLAFQLLLEKVVVLKAKQEDFNLIAAQLDKHKVDAQAMTWIRNLTLNIANNSNLLKKYANPMLDLLFKMSTGNSQYRDIQTFEAKLLFLQASLLAAKNEPDLAYRRAKEAFDVDCDVELGISMASDLGNRGARMQALKLLSDLSVFLKKQVHISSKVNKVYYDVQIEKLRKDILLDIENDYSDLSKGQKVQ